jgi:hypothetical protein
MIWQDNQWRSWFYWAVFILICVFGLGSVILVLVLTGCGGAGEGCTPEALRCRGTRLEVCEADRHWARVVDCADVTPGAWACCLAAETCLPVGACSGDAGDHFADGGNMGDAGL